MKEWQERGTKKNERRSSDLGQKDGEARLGLEKMLEEARVGHHGRKE